jgi:hypothetical protein
MAVDGNFANWRGIASPASPWKLSRTWIEAEERNQPEFFELA